MHQYKNLYNDLNSNVYASTPYILLCKVGRIVILQIHGADAYLYRYEARTKIIDSYHLDYLPICEVYFVGHIYLSDNNTYIGSLTLDRNGCLLAKYYNSISELGVIANSGHKIYAECSYMVAEE